MTSQVSAQTPAPAGTAASTPPSALGTSAPGTSKAGTSETGSESTAFGESLDVSLFVRPEKPAVWAEQSKAIKQAQQAKELAKQGDCATAVPLFADAYRRAGQVAALRGALDCATRNGEWVRAHALMELLLQNHPEKTKQAEQAAELHALANKTALLSVRSETPDATLTLAGKPVTTERQRLLPGQYVLRVEKPGHEPFEEALVLAAGADETRAVTLQPVVQAPLPTVDKKEVTDFCLLPRPQANSSSYKKQRLVIFDLDGEAITHQPEQEVNEKGDVIGQHQVFQSIAAHNHLRNVFFGTFPLKRFSTVSARVPAPASLGEGSVSSEAMIQAAGVDDFAAYSIACADWVVVPRVVSKAASWKKVELTRTVYQNNKPVEVKYWAWSLSATLEYQAHVYRFDNDQWKHHASVTGSNGGLLGTALEITELAPGGKATSGQAPLLSPPPEPTCRVPLASNISALSDAFQACGEAATKMVSLASAGVDELKAKVEAEDQAEKEAAAEAAAKQAEKEAAAKAEKEAAAKQGEGTAKDAAEGAEESEPSADGAAVEADPKPGDDKEEAQTTKPSDKLDSDGAPTKAGKQEPSQGDSAQDAPLAADAQKADNTKAAPEPEEETEHEQWLKVLDAASSGDPTSNLMRLASVEASEELPNVSRSVVAAKEAISTCQGGVKATAALSGELRKLASNPTQALAEGALGFAACAGVPLMFDLGEATPPGTAQRKSEYCKHVTNDVSLGLQAMQAVATCEGRVSGERATLALQNEAKRLDGWKLFAPLIERPKDTDEGYGISMGTNEGAKRGDVYIAVSEQASGSLQRLGFGRIVRVGPGGEQGATEPSHFKFRSGEAPLGTRMEEWSQIGVLLGVRPQAGMLLAKGDLSSKVIGGAAIQGGYNASQFVSFADEVWARVNLAYWVGTENESFFSIELVPEVQYYAFGGAAWYVASGMAYAGAMKSYSPVEAATLGIFTLEDINVTGAGAAIVVALGMDYALSPDWSLRGGVEGRQGLSNVELKDKDERITLNGGTLTAVQGTLAGSFTF